MTNITIEELKIFESIKANGKYGLERTFMDKEEIKIANNLVKKGLVTKGIQDNKQKNITYWVEQ